MWELAPRRARLAMSRSKAVFAAIEAALKAGKGAELVKQFGGVACFKVGDATYTLDLKNGNGALTEGGADAGAADVTITTSDDVFADLAAGKQNPQMALCVPPVRRAARPAKARGPRLAAHFPREGPTHHEVPPAPPANTLRAPRSMGGKLKFTGSMALAMKLGTVLKAAGEALPKAKL